MKHSPWAAVILLSFFHLSVQDSGSIRNDIKNGRRPIRGVNLGGWLVAEHWMTRGSPAWNGVPDNVADGGEYVTMKNLGHGRGDSQFEAHRNNFITEQDFADISSHGLNTVRIPIGYWIVGFDNSGGGDPNGWKVYAPGALKYLDKAIREWAPRHNLVVLISFHAAKGSQNGEAHSAPEDPGHSYWAQYSENVRNTLDAVQWLAARYKNDAAFLGIGMLNEPTQDQYENVLKQYYLDVYGRVRYNVNTDCLLVTAPFLDQQYPNDHGWNTFMPPPGFNTIRHDWHKYMVWGFEPENGWNAQKVINYVNNDLKNQITSWNGNWLYIGEWSMAAKVGMSDNDMRNFGNAQLNTFSKAVGGWTFWTWKFYDNGSYKNGWSMKSMIQNGFLPSRF